LDFDRKVVYHLLSLPHVQIIEIVTNLGLLMDEDKELDIEGLELYRRFIKRAKERGLMIQLWDMIKDKEK